MPLEQEVPFLLTTGFIVVILIFAISTIVVWVKNKANYTPYIMILLHLVLLSAGFYFLMNAITLDYNHPMASEENSLNIGIASVFWALSMLSILKAIVKFSRKN